jgi:plastocyanin
MAEVSQRGLLLAVAAGLALLCSIGHSAMAKAPGPAAHTVVIEGMQFSPATLTVKVGDKVTWINRDLFPHTVTAEQRRFDSHAIAAGGSWTFTPRKVGVTSYGCTFHPTMRGTLRVE